jgi:hypothetical protein
MVIQLNSQTLFQYPQCPNRLSLFYFKVRDNFLDILNPVSNVFYETSSNTRLYALADKESRVLIFGDLPKVKTILDHYVTDFGKQP